MNEELTEGCTLGKQGRKPTCVPVILADIDAGHTLNTKDGKKTIVGIGLIEGCVGLAVWLGAMGGVLSANAMPKGLSED